MLKKKLISVLIILLILFNINNFAHACIGKTITIGYKNFMEQRILAEILYVIITERTGTTVVLKSFSNTQECLDALQKEEISLYVEYLGVAYNDVLHKDTTQHENQDIILEAVKNDFNQKRNLVWLNFFNFESLASENESIRKKGLSLKPAPIIGKEALKMFPVLPRLLNKLVGNVDSSSIRDLINLVNKDKMDPKTVAQNFLKAKKLI